MCACVALLLEAASHSFPQHQSCAGSSAVQVFFFSSRRRHTRYIGDWSFRRVLFRSKRRPWLASLLRSCRVSPRRSATKRASNCSPNSKRSPSRKRRRCSPSAWASPELPERKCRSEERRVGKGVDLGDGRIEMKKGGR